MNNGLFLYHTVNTTLQVLHLSTLRLDLALVCIFHFVSVFVGYVSTKET